MAISIAEEYSLPSFVRGYRECKHLWTLSWTELVTKEEAANPLDKFEIAVLLDDDVVRHLPKRKLGR